MVRGIDSFREWFEGYERYYTIIGGTACDLLMNEADEVFRATRDIDMVLLIEELDSNFGIRLWDYIKAGGYEHRRASIDGPQFYRFSKPVSGNYPHMIELFSRHLEKFALPDDAVLTPIPVEDDISSLSAILLDDNYYDFLKSGVRMIDGLPIIEAERLIPFKAKAWLDLTQRKKNGIHVDSKHIRKHKADIVTLSVLLQGNDLIILPDAIYKDLAEFLEANVRDDERLRRVGTVYGISMS